MITSPQNPRVVTARALHESKHRRREGAFLIEGVRLLEEAVQADLKIADGFYLKAATESPRSHRLLTALSTAGAELYEVSERVLKTLSQTEQAQGIVVTALQPKFDVVWDHEARFLVADRVQDPGNLGTMIRLASAFACRALLVLEGGVDPWNDKVVRSSMGASFHLPLLEYDAAELLEKLRRTAIPLRVADLSAEKTLQDLNWHGGWALVIGNEGAGVSAPLREAAEECFVIPMPGHAESLNAASAAAIALYEANREVR